jgi:MbtH protein
MLTNPFEDDSAKYVVLINDERQYSLWPETIEIPQGWTACSAGTRQECLAWIDANWTDMRPQTLVQRMAVGA